MRWPWSRREKRDSGGDFSDAVVRLIQAQAAGTAADASSTAAVEAAKRDGIVRTSRDHATQHGREVGFERWCGDTPDCCVGWIAPCPLLQRCRDIVAIELATPPIREGRRHRLTIRVEEAPGQRGIRLLLTIRCPTASVRVEARLNSLEEIAIDDGLVSARMHPGIVTLNAPTSFGVACRDANHLIHTPSISA